MIDYKSAGLTDVFKVEPPPPKQTPFGAPAQNSASQGKSAAEMWKMYSCQAKVELARKQVPATPKSESFFDQLERVARVTSIPIYMSYTLVTLYIQQSRIC